MAKRRTHKLPQRAPPPQPAAFFVLDQFSRADIETWRTRWQAVLRYHWQFYSELAFQRSRIADQLREALLGAAVPLHEFASRYRVVRAKYATMPLSPVGSLKEPGGRFNMPDIAPDQFPPFPALYMAEDRETALIEHFGMRAAQEGMSPEEYALVSPGTVLIASVSGKLASVIDLRQPGRLEPFLNLIKDFSVSTHVHELARRAGGPPLTVVRTMDRLQRALLEGNWRALPMQFNVPASCQIFGQLVHGAGISAIAYSSQYTGKECLAVYLQNLQNESFIQLDAEVVPGTRVSRVDAGNWKEVVAPWPNL